MANIFDINWANVTENLTPWFWRKTADNQEAKMLPYWRSMITPVQDISDDLLELQLETVDFLQYTGQHKVLEEYLNNLYDNALRRIYITENNIAAIDPVQMGVSDDAVVPGEVVMGISGDTVIVPVAMALSGEGLVDSNFTVNIPTSIVFDSDILTAQLRNYVEASKTFNFVTF
jgi:hypothetical protein